MSWLIYKGKVIGTYTFIYAQKVWGLLQKKKIKKTKGNNEKKYISKTT